MIYEISLIVIGKNESQNLSRLINSISILGDYEDIDSEFIYVDSASSDNSVEIASKFFDKVLTLESSKNLCAAAGRYIGTINANKKWVLYLDGDMELCEEFIDNIRQFIGPNHDNVGFLGKYVHVYNDGTIRSDGYGPKNNFYHKNELYVRHFGGAVLLPRKLVLKAGNYNPGVFSNEEIDLHTRIRGVGGRVKFIDIEMIRHNTFHFSELDTFIGFYWPTKFLGKKFYGFGQLIASRFSNNNILNLVRYFPYPFIFLGSLILSIAIFLIGCIFLAMILTMSAISYLSYSKGIKFTLLYPGLIMQIIFGWKKYDSEYIPKVLK
ncbi:glycosyltransferase [Gammaproteobacteria bacterium]|nr:glycosyltransferase [Gammaproteobacteria bacterium]